MSIILVGNGPSLLGRDLGFVIDSHDTVVRFNGFQIKGYEKHVGVKTDVWVRHAFCREVRDAPKKLVKVSRGRPKPRFEWFRPGDTLMSEAAEIYVEAVCGPAQSGKCYSTGLVTLAHYALEFGGTGEQVVLVGFDGLKERRNHHYYKDSSVNELHMPDREAEFIKKMTELCLCRVI